MGVRRPALAREVLPVGIAAIMLLAFVLPYYTRRPFWFDELVSIEIARLGAGDFARYVATVESNMGLYHALLSLWLRLGEAEAWVRLPSIAFALATLPFVYALGLRLFDRRTAVIAVLLLAANVSFVGHARDARGYALALLLVTASSFFLVRATQEDRPSDWALYSVIASLAVWAHLLAGVVLLAHVLWLLLQRDVVQRRHALLALGGAGLLLAPLVAQVHFSGQGAQLDWLDPPELRRLPGLFEWFVESRATLVVYFAGAAVALVSLRRRASFLLLWLGLPPLVVFALSYATPLYLYRYFLFSLPALVLLVAAGFGRLRPAALGVVLTAATLLLSARTVASCQPDCKLRHDDWEAAATYLDEWQRGGDAIVIYPPQVRTALDHYLGSSRPKLLFPERWGLAGRGQGSDTLAAALDRAAVRGRIWLVTWWLPAEAARDAVAARARLVSAREFAGNIHVDLYRSP
jgi:mannosyltransferase